MNINRNFNYGSVRQNIVRQSSNDKNTPEKTNSTEKREEPQSVQKNEIKTAKSEPLLDELNIISANNQVKIKTFNTVQPKQESSVRQEVELKEETLKNKTENEQTSDDKMAATTFSESSSFWGTVWDIVSQFLPKMLGTIVAVMTPMTLGTGDTINNRPTIRSKDYGPNTLPTIDVTPNGNNSYGYDIEIGNI